MATVRVGELTDIPGFITLASEVEQWFGPMVADPGFHEAVRRNIERGSAFVVDGNHGSDGSDGGDGRLRGAMLTGGRAPSFRVNWLVVAAKWRRHGVGRALMDHVTERWPRPCEIEVVTFGADHPTGSQVFYEKLGFVAGEAAADGPEGGSRQYFRIRLR